MLTTRFRELDTLEFADRERRADPGQRQWRLPDDDPRTLWRRCRTFINNKVVRATGGGSVILTGNGGKRIWRQWNV